MVPTTLHWGVDRDKQLMLDLLGFNKLDFCFWVWNTYWRRRLCIYTVCTNKKLKKVRLFLAMNNSCKNSQNFLTTQFSFIIWVSLQIIVFLLSNNPLLCHPPHTEHVGQMHHLVTMTVLVYYHQYNSNKYIRYI